MNDAFRMGERAESAHTGPQLVRGTAAAGADELTGRPRDLAAHVRPHGTGFARRVPFAYLPLGIWPFLVAVICAPMTRLIKP